MELIKHAAWKRKDGSYAKGKHHGICLQTSPPDTCLKGRDAQGFLTDKGRFVGREEAAEIAFKAGQIDEQPSILFSEHMWHRVYKGRHKYDTVNGYQPGEGEMIWD